MTFGKGGAAFMNNATTGKLVALSAAWPGLRYLSLGVLSVWTYLVMDFGAWMTWSDGVNTSVIHVSMYMYLVSAALLLAAAFAQQTFRRICEHRFAPVVFAAIAAVGTVMLIVSGPVFLRLHDFSRILFRIGAVLNGASLGFMVLHIGQLYCELEPNKVFLYALVSELVVAVLFYAVIGNAWFAPLADGPALSYLLAVVAAPALAMFLSTLPKRNGETEDEDEDSPSLLNVSLRSFFAAMPMMRKLLSAILAFSVAASVVCNCFAVGQAPDAYQLYAQQAMLLRAIFATCLLLVAVFYAGKLSLGKLYLVGMVALAIIITVLPMIGLNSGVLVACTDTLLYMINLVVWCLLAFVAKAGGLRSCLVFGLGKGVSHAGLGVGYALNYFGVLATVQESGIVSAPMAVTLIALILVCVVLIFTEKDFDAILEVSGATNLNVRAALAANRVAERQEKLDRPWQKACWVVGERAMLSNREQELLEELSRNRTPQEIAAKLNITVATVRTHTHRIYVKLNVHSREELIELVRDEYEVLK